MSAFFFGPSDRQLFGYHHAPHSAGGRPVLLCPPWSREYEFAHRSLRILAGQLAAVGRHVLRFDYSCTGDSGGDSSETDMDRWYDDVGHAAAELRMMSGESRIDLVGLRLGGLVAAIAATRIGDLGGVVLWDPITDGNAWIRQLEGERTVEGASELRELGHYAVPLSFVDQVRSIRDSVFEPIPCDRGLHLVTRSEPWGRQAPTALSGFEHEFVEQPTPWVEDESIWTGQVPVEALKRIVEWLG